MRKKGFTLIELLVVIAVIALVISIIVPLLGRVRLLGKVTAVNAELRYIALALHMYGTDHEDKFPPVRWDCGNADNYFQLPRELSELEYLAQGDKSKGVSANIEDRFNRPRTYKYMAVGPQFGNNDMPVDDLALWIPDGFPDNEQETGSYYDKPNLSPVTWVLFSIGPNYDSYELRQMKYPVPSKTWFNANKRAGVITRIRMKNGRQTGSFEIK